MHTWPSPEQSASRPSFFTLERPSGRTAWVPDPISPFRRRPDLYGGPKAGGVGRAFFVLVFGLDLPGTACLGRAATGVLAARGTRAASRAVGPGERELNARGPGRGHPDRVARVAVRRHGHAARGVVQRRLDVEDRRLVAVRVVVVVVVRTGLHRPLGGGDARLRLGVVSLALLVQEQGNGYRGEEADDQEDDQELDQGETLLFLDALAEPAEHAFPFRRASARPRARLGWTQEIDRLAGASV